MQDHLEVLALAVRGLALPAVLALGVLELDLNIQLCILLLVKCRLSSGCMQCKEIAQDF